MSGVFQGAEGGSIRLRFLADEAKTSCLFVATIKPCRPGTKRRSNVKDHGLDFNGCDAIFDGPTVSWDDDRVAYGEQRINLLGWLDGIVVHMTYTERGDEPHIVSLRKAEKHEIRRYVKEVSR